MSVAPRVVVVHRHSERDEIVAEQGTWGQAEFVQKRRGVSLSSVKKRHDMLSGAVQAVSATIPKEWRRGTVERSDLPRFLFEPEDVVVVVGQDGLVANTAKYLNGQPVIGIDPDPGRNMGVLVRHSPANFESLLAQISAGRARFEARTMVAAATDDGESLLALNEVYLGHSGHQSARYLLSTPEGEEEHQLVVGAAGGVGDRGDGVAAVDRAAAGAPDRAAGADGSGAGMVRAGGVAVADDRGFADRGAAAERGGADDPHRGRVAGGVRGRDRGRPAGARVGADGADPGCGAASSAGGIERA